MEPLDRLPFGAVGQIRPCFEQMYWSIAAENVLVIQTDRQKKGQDRLDYDQLKSRVEDEYDLLAWRHNNEFGQIDCK